MVIIRHYPSSHWSVLRSHSYADIQTFLTSCYVVDLAGKRSLSFAVSKPLFVAGAVKKKGCQFLTVSFCLPFTRSVHSSHTIPMNSNILNKEHLVRHQDVLLCCWQEWVLRECGGTIIYIGCYFVFFPPPFHNSSHDHAFNECLSYYDLESYMF